MPIKIQHDVAAVSPPSNATTRKYGQSLVQQQRQQDFLGKQADYDRMFKAQSQLQENQWQAVRDQFKNEMEFRREGRQNQFILERDKSQQEARLKEQEAERQRAFMEQARKQSSGMIMDDVNNNLYDPVTARKLQQNLVSESEALGNPNLDATQRAEALSKIRAERSMLTASRLEKPPAPSAQEEFDQGVVVRNGVEYRKNAKGEFVPLTPQQKQQEQQQPQRPTSADEAFQADQKIRDKYMADAIAIETKGGEEPLTRESRKRAAELAKQLYEEDNNLGTPTEAPVLPGSVPPPIPGQERSILEQAGTPTEAPVLPGSVPTPAQGQERSILEQATEAPLIRDMRQDVTSKGKRSILEDATDAPAAAPDFEALAASASDDADRAAVGKLQGLYEQNKSPEVRSAIAVLLSQAPSQERGRAYAYLQSVGIDLGALTAPPKNELTPPHRMPGMPSGRPIPLGF